MPFVRFELLTLAITRKKGEGVGVLYVSDLIGLKIKARGSSLINIPC